MYAYFQSWAQTLHSTKNHFLIILLLKYLYCIYFLAIFESKKKKLVPLGVFQRFVLNVMFLMLTLLILF